MKKLSLFLVFILIIGAFSSCEGIGDDPPAVTVGQSASAQAGAFAFSYELEKTQYARGETVRIKATVTNASGKDYEYTGSSTEFFSSVSLYWTWQGDEKGGVIEHDPIAITDDYTKMTIKDGEGGSRIFTFVIPEDAECTDYSITLAYGGESKEFPGVLTVTE